jgi:ABC-type lipoprotein export system ATPase subunit
LNKFQKGSVWRRWDLHIHSPASALNNHFEGSDENEKWSNYIEALKTIRNISVLGITDYYSIEGYLRVRSEFDSGNIPNIDQVLANVELRVDVRTDAGRPLNLHIIFHPDIVASLESRFFTELKFKVGADTRPYKCTRGDLTELGKEILGESEVEDHVAYAKGVEQFKVNLTDLEELFQNDQELRKKAFIIVPNNSNDGNSGLREDSFSAVRRRIYHFVDGIFSSRPGDISYFLGHGADSPEDVIKNCGALLPCFHGSDAHSTSDIGVVHEDRFNFIKADPTFEGLVQAKFEPEERVFIGSVNPKDNYEKPYFSKLLIPSEYVYTNGSVKFKGDEIELNDGLVSIIGGRGSGKSLLLNSIKDTFNHEKITSLEEFHVIYNKIDSENLEFKSKNQNNLDYLHVSQGEMKDVVNNPEKLDVEIRKMLEMDLELKDNQNRDTITRLIERLTEILVTINLRNEDGELENTIAFCKSKIEQFNELLSTITTTKNKKLIGEFTQNQTKLLEAKSISKKLEGLLETSNQYVESLNEQISSVNTTDLVGMEITQIDNLKLKDDIAKFSVELNKASSYIQDKNNEITGELREAGVKGDISSVLLKAKDYQGNLEFYNNKLVEIQEMHDELEKKFNLILVEGARCKDYLESELENVKNAWEALKEGRESWTEQQKEITRKLVEDIDIDSQIRFSKVDFLRVVETVLNKSKFRQTKSESTEQRIDNFFKVENFDDYIKMISNEEVFNLDGDDVVNLRSFIEKDFLLRDAEGKFLKMITLPEYRDKYLKVVSTIKYKGKEPSHLSVGQRGTLYLSLKLATETFGTPLIFDQPEDDLDNNFIMTKLIPLLKDVKKYRQVIIVTHNANVVVNGDSEQVIVANNTDEIISYIAGGIESDYRDCEIRRSICNTLEGGKQAFKNRERKYGF